MRKQISSNGKTKSFSEQVSGVVEGTPPGQKRQKRRVGSVLGNFVRGVGYQIVRIRRFFFKGRIPDYPVIVLSGELVERTPQLPWWQQLIPGRKAPVSLEALHEAFQRIAADPKTDGVVVLFKSPKIGLVQAQSLIALFDRFREWSKERSAAGVASKKVIVHIEDGMMDSYVAACGADQIFMTPLTEWRVLGLRFGSLFLKETLARIGIEFDVIRIAPWKSAGDVYNRTSMSEESREQYNWLADSLYQTIVSTISQRRNLTHDAVRNLIDHAPLKATDALSSDLIDGIYYEDEIPVALSWGTQAATLKPWEECGHLLLRQDVQRSRQAVGIISLSGTIVPGKSRDLPVPLPLLGDEQIGSSTVQQLVRAAREDDRLAAVVLHVDSPGGSALASDVMWRELTLLNEEKPLVVYMGNVAASGGYYIATPARKIVAQSTTITGSIGVLSAKPSLRGTYNKIGANRESVQRGANVMLYDENSRWTPEQVAQIEESIQYMYREFKERVACGRGLNFESLDSICQGRVWTGAQALENGLVDSLGDLQVAVQQACQLAELPGDGSIRVANIYVPKETRLAEPLRETAGQFRWGSTRDLRQLLRSVARGNWSELLHAEQHWYLIEELPTFL